VERECVERLGMERQRLELIDVVMTAP
jgi:hypothetical protein